MIAVYSTTRETTTTASWWITPIATDSPSAGDPANLRGGEQNLGDVDFLYDVGHRERKKILRVGDDAVRFKRPIINN